MKELQTVLNNILTDKNTNLKPENLKKGVTCLGVTGTLEASASSGGVKQFSTVEEMNASTGNTEGDLAVVYRSEVQNATVDSRFQVATFPDTVVLDTALTDYVEVRYRAVDSSVMFDCMGQLDSSMFSMDCYTESGSVRITYESSDGITYTRTDTTGNPVDFGTEIYYEMTEMWNDAIGKFIQIGGSTFEGLFKYSSYLDKSMFRFVKLNDITITDNVAYWNGNYDETAYDVEKLKSLYRKMYNDGITSNQRGYFALNENNQLICFSYYFVSTGKINGNAPDRIVHNGSGCIGLSNTILSGNNDPSTIYVYALDLENQTYTKIMETSNRGTITISGSNYYTYPVILNSVPIYWAGDENDIEYKLYPIWITSNLMDSATGTACNVTNVANNINLYETKHKYFLAPSQLTATSDDVYIQTFYGKDGAEIGTLQNKENLTTKQVQKKVEIWNNFNEGIICPEDMTDAFKDMTITAIPKLNTSNVNTMVFTFIRCTNLTTIPLIDTSNVTNAYGMFHSCSSLITIPPLDMSNNGNTAYMFYDCINLISAPLSNANNLINTRYMFCNCKSITEIPQLNTSKVITMNSMFYGCIKLTTLPQLDAAGITANTGLETMFYNCPNLSDESLNNILLMCANFSGYTGTKTLKHMSLTEEQATKCTTLSNYQAFLDAGWTTGY